MKTLTFLLCTGEEDARKRATSYVTWRRILVIGYRGGDCIIIIIIIIIINIALVVRLFFPVGTAFVILHIL